MEVIIECKAKGNQTMIIDEEDYDNIKDLNLSLNYTSNKNTYYAKSRVYEVDKVIIFDKPSKYGHTQKKTWKYIKSIHIHRLIMGLGDYKDDKRIVHHKDGNGLNNQKANLEICDKMYNSQSCRMKKTQGLIYFDNTMKRIKRWRASIVIMGVKYEKRFETEQQAKDWINEIKPVDEIS